uniref:Putative secreted protein n=1 Tax=Anopheles darlingi TaxID=43151 RepID=A0A2M4D5E5_ANODA
MLAAAIEPVPRPKLVVIPPLLVGLPVRSIVAGEPPPPPSTEMDRSSCFNCFIVAFFERPPAPTPPTPEDTDNDDEEPEPEN